jgi:threonine dehydratase
VRALGAEVLLEGVTSIERKARADAEAGERGLTMIPPFDHEWIIAGQGTVGLEIAAQCADVDLVDVYVPTGGGGLLSGVATAIKALRPSVRVIGVEPVGAAKMSASLRAGHPVTLPGTHSIADGLLPVRPGDLTFAHVRAFVDEVVTVGEDELASATGWLFREAKLVAEPSGAAAVAAVHRARQSGRARGTAVAVISGGNISVSDLVRLIE